MKIINQDLVLDGFYRKILNHLVENAKIHILEIVRNIRAFDVPVQQRANKM